MERAWDAAEVRRHLRQICAARAPSMSLKAPADVVMRREPWSVATDGRMVLAVHSIGYGAVAAKFQQSLIALLSLPPETPLIIKLRTLRNWCGAAPRWLSLTCPYKSSSCYECRGSGTITRLAVENDYGVVSDKVFDRHRLAKLLQPFREQQDVELRVDRVEPGRLVVDGGTWRAVLSPVHLPVTRSIPRLDEALHGR